MDLTEDRLKAAVTLNTDAYHGPIEDLYRDLAAQTLADHHDGAAFGLALAVKDLLIKLDRCKADLTQARAQIVRLEGMIDPQQLVIGEQL